MRSITLPDGATLSVRPIEPDDVDRLARFFTRLSPTTVYRRFFSPVTHPPRRTLAWLAAVDHDRREALVALDGDEIVAVARYDGHPGTPTAEIAVTVEDDWQHRGVGMRLARRLAAQALDHGFDEFVAIMLGDNQPALRLVRRVSPDADVRFDGGGFSARMPLSRAG
jgi:GNAT superfamily N-acetyltransferase